jgi:hypothetical protein
MHGDCLVKHVIEGKTETGIEVWGRGRRRKQLQDGLMERRGYRKLKEEAEERIVWSTRSPRTYRPVVGQSTKRNE